MNTGTRVHFMGTREAVCGPGYEQPGASRSPRGPRAEWGRERGGQRGLRGQASRGQASRWAGLSGERGHAAGERPSLWTEFWKSVSLGLRPQASGRSVSAPPARLSCPTLSAWLRPLPQELPSGSAKPVLVQRPLSVSGGGKRRSGACCDRDCAGQLGGGGAATLGGDQHRGRTCSSRGSRKAEPVMAWASGPANRQTEETDRQQEKEQQSSARRSRPSGNRALLQTGGGQHLWEGRARGQPQCPRRSPAVRQAKSQASVAPSRKHSQAVPAGSAGATGEVRRDPRQPPCARAGRTGTPQLELPRVTSHADWWHKGVTGTSQDTWGQTQMGKKRPASGPWEPRGRPPTPTALLRGLRRQPTPPAGPPARPQS